MQVGANTRAHEQATESVSSSSSSESPAAHQAIGLAVCSVSKLTIAVHLSADGAIVTVLAVTGGKGTGHPTKPGSSRAYSEEGEQAGTNEATSAMAEGKEGGALVRANMKIHICKMKNKK